MLLRKLSTTTSIKYFLKRSFYQSPKVFSDILTPSPKDAANKTGENDIPTYADIVVIGGGAMGSAIAYWLKEKSQAFSVVVVERDSTYKDCSTCLSCGGIRQQFSLAENIQMGFYGTEFFRTLKQRFGPDADVNFRPHGYLVLATEKGAEQLIKNNKLQKEFGAVNTVLRKQELQDRFPWIKLDDIAIGCLGLENEGWFDPWSLLQLLKNGAAAKGTHYVNANVVDFMLEERSDIIVNDINQDSYEHPKQVVIETPDGETRTIDFNLCVIAAGPESGKVAERLKIGTGNGILSVPLPVERRKRFVYAFACRGDIPPTTPLCFDKTGAYFRREGLGRDFIGGLAPELKDEPDTTNLDVDYSFWDQTVWPILAERVPAFNEVKLKSAWAGFYEFNRFDENGIIGAHPYYSNVYIATGFSGHGVQQSPAVGRAIAELILDGKFKTIDLTRLGFDRLITNKPMCETLCF